MKKRIVAMLVAVVLCMGVTGALAAYGRGYVDADGDGVCDNAGVGCGLYGMGRGYVDRRTATACATTRATGHTALGAERAGADNETGKRDAECAASRRSTGPWSGTPIRFAGCA